MAPSMRSTPREASPAASVSMSTIRTDGSPIPRITTSPLMTPLPSGGGPVSSVRKRKPLPSRMSAVVVASTFWLEAGSISVVPPRR